MRKNGVTCIRETAKHTPELAKLIVNLILNGGAAAALVDYVEGASGSNNLPAGI